MTEPSPWVAALSVLPAKLRLEVQKSVTQDVVAQRDMPPQPPVSRAYASTNTEKLQPRSGPGVAASALDGLGVGRRATGAGNHLSAVSRAFPDTAHVLAELILQSARKAGMQPRLPFGPAGEGSAAQAVGKQEVDLLAEELRQRGLDAAYRVTLARYLQRTLATGPGAGAGASAGSASSAGPWRTEAEAHPDKYAALLAAADGSLATVAQAAFEDLQRQLAGDTSGGPGQAANGTSSSAQATAAGQAKATKAPAPAHDLDAMLDDALDDLLG